MNNERTYVLGESTVEYEGPKDGPLSPKPLSDYTKGPLYLVPCDDGDNAMITDQTAAIVICNDARDEITPSMADMHEIVRRWNAHDGLLAAVEYALERTAMNGSKEVYSAAIAKAKGEG